MSKEKRTKNMERIDGVERVENIEGIGKPKEVVSVGDIVLVHGHGVVDRLIQFGERIRDSKEASYYNHAAYIVGSNGLLLQATGRGIEFGNFYTSFATDETLVIPNPLGRFQTQDALKFANSCINVKYGYLEIVSIGCDLLTPHFIHFKSGNTLICSEFVAKILEHGGWISPKLDTSHVMPSDLYNYFK